MVIRKFLGIHIQAEVLILIKERIKLQLTQTALIVI